MTTCTKPHSEPWARVANFGTEGQETIGTYKTFAEAQDAAANYGGVLAQRVLADNGDWSLVVPVHTSAGCTAVQSTGVNSK